MKEKINWAEYGCASATEYFIKLKEKKSRELARLSKEELIRRIKKAEKKFEKMKAAS